jgi:type II secretory pathway pseudopilin PulG
MVVVAILGILAVIAVPAFVKYLRRAKTVEAVDELDKIYKGAAYYYASSHIMSSDGHRIDCQFPASQGLTPTQSCCASGQDSDDDGRCDSNPNRWNTQTWSALSFQVTDQVYFRYSFDSNGGVLRAAKATANAHADLDCDGTFSTFQRLMFGDPGAAPGNDCSLTGASALFVDNETE